MALTTADLTGSVTTSTDYVVSGAGVFDDLMETVTSHLDAQYNLGRITGKDYATVYLGALQATLQQAVAYCLGQEKTNAEVALLAQKEITEYAQTEQITPTAPVATSILGAQSNLLQEQAKGFKWNADQKYLKTLMDAWSVNVSTAGVAVTTVDAIQSAGGPDDLNVQIANAKPTG